MATVPVVDRPREKLARVGAEALGDNELIALVLGSGTRSRGALLVAQDVIHAAGEAQGLLRIGLDELCRVPGVGVSRAARLLAAVELGRRTLFGDRGERPQMLSTKDVVDYLAPRYAGFAVERFGVLLLDQKHRVLRSVILSSGTVEASVSHPRDLFRVAMLASASYVVAFHNHPSGDPAPSVADRVITRRLHLIGRLIGIELMDHIILGGTAFFSFRAEGFNEDPLL
jgi:DNA repair protein RadC